MRLIDAALRLEETRDVHELRPLLQKAT